MNLRMAKIVITLRFFVNIRAAKAMAIRAAPVHSAALLTELTTIIIGTVSRKNSRIVWTRYKFSRVIRANFVSERSKRAQKR